MSLKHRKAGPAAQGKERQRACLIPRAILQCRQRIKGNTGQPSRLTQGCTVPPHHHYLLPHTAEKGLGCRFPRIVSIPPQGRAQCRNLLTPRRQVLCQAEGAVNRPQRLYVERHRPRLTLMYETTLLSVRIPT